MLQFSCFQFCFVFHFRVIQNIADSRPKVRYLIAKDDSNNTLFEIVKVRTNRFEKNSNLFL